MWNRLKVNSKKGHLGYEERCISDAVNLRYRAASMICPRCSAEAQTRGARHCTKCGGALDSPITAVPNPTKDANLLYAYPPNASWKIKQRIVRMLTWSVYVLFVAPIFFEFHGAILWLFVSSGTLFFLSAAAYIAIQRRPIEPANRAEKAKSTFKQVGAVTFLAFLASGPWWQQEKERPKSQPATVQATQSAQPDDRVGMQNTDADIPENLRTLEQFAQDPSFARYHDRILEFITLFTQLHGVAHERCQAAILRKDEPGETGYCLWHSFIGVCIDDLGEVLREHRSGEYRFQPIRKDTIESVRKNREQKKKLDPIVKTFSHDQTAVRAFGENTATLARLLDAGDRSNNDAARLVDQSDDLDAWLASFKASILISSVEYRLLPYQMASERK